MADEPILEAADTKPVHAPTNPKTIQMAAALAAILTISLFFWLQVAKSAGVRRIAFGKGIDGLSAALAIPIVETGSQRFENRGDRLQKIVEAIQRSGGYQSVVVTDPSGNVLATTDTSLKGQIVKEMATPKTPSKISETDGVVEILAPVVGDGDTVVGTVRVRSKI